MRGELIAFYVLGSLLQASAQSTLVPPLYKSFPVGAVKPHGWALNQAKVQADGLAGHARDFYSYVAGSVWVPDGTMEYSEMLEAAPYWFNGAVAHAFQLNDKRLIGQVRDFLDHLIDTQQEDGWIGPENPNTALPRLVWPRYLILLGMAQYAEADPTQTQRIVDSMHRFVSLVHDIWKNGKQGNESMGFQYGYQHVRWEELLHSLQWLYDNYPQGKEAQLIETMKLVKEDGFDWKNEWFTDAIFPKTAVPGQRANHHTHGVNIAQALKSEVLAYRYTHDPTDVQSTWDRLDMLYKYHGRASGTFAADEHLAGMNPSRGTETCTVVEQMFSLEQIYGMFGNSSIADRIEKLAYNAAPAASLADMWTHQYDQQVNQLWLKNITQGTLPWGTNGGYSGVMGMESNYPCCTVNHPQAFPKFWKYNFFSADKGTALIHALLGPSQFKGTLADNNAVEVTVDTIYPFSSTLQYTVNAKKAFTLGIRVPGYAVGSNLSTISVNGQKATALKPTAGYSIHSVKLLAGKSTIIVNLNMPLEVEKRSTGAVTVTRGPLNYAVQLKYNSSTTPGWRNPQALNDAKRLWPNADPQWFTEWDDHAKDVTLLATEEWRLAIDPESISVIASNPKTLPKEVWAPGVPPVRMTATACQIAWGITNNAASEPPQSPVACVGKPFNVTLAPFASSPVRLAEIPVMSK